MATADKTPTASSPPPAEDGEGAEDGEYDEEPEAKEEDVEALAPSLLDAIQTNDAEKALSLLERGVPPSGFTTSSSGRKWSTLHWASFNGNVTLVARLLEQGTAQGYLEAKELQRAEEHLTSEQAEELIGTPLHWACTKGHSRIVWLLLQAGFSAHDVDELMNTPLHLAATNGHAASARLLLEEGARCEDLNAFQNTPLDLATDEQTRLLLKASMQAKQPGKSHVKSTHKNNQHRTTVAEAALKEAMVEIGTMSMGDDDMQGWLVKLESLIASAEAVNVLPSLIQQAKSRLSQLHTWLDLSERLHNLERNRPILAPKSYETYVNSITRGLKRAAADTSDPFPPELQNRATQAVERSHAEYWLGIACKKFDDVDIATEQHTRELKKLQSCIARGKDKGAFAELVQTADSLQNRLTAEIALQNALSSIPEVRLPIEEPDKDYWDEAEDVGRIEETEDFPLPPESGEYEWISSTALTKLRTARDRITACIHEAEGHGANQSLKDEATHALDQVLANVKSLEVKDAEDKQAAVAVAEKLAKKLKKKKGKGK